MKTQATESASVKDAARDEFDKWAHGYDKSILQRFLFKPSHDLILGEIDLKKPCRILDIGCGTCVFAFNIALSSPSSKIFCMDLSREMVGRARNKLNGCKVAPGSMGSVKIKIADSERLPYAANSFDYITCSNSFHHYPHQDRVAAEMFRVLKPGGKALIVDGNKDGMFGHFVYDGLVAFFEGDVKHLSSGEFRSLFAGCGFSPVTHKKNKIGVPILLTVAVAKK